MCLGLIESQFYFFIFSLAYIKARRVEIKLKTGLGHNRTYISRIALLVLFCNDRIVTFSDNNI